MPFIDVTDIILDPDIAGEQFTVIRRVETVTSAGIRTNTTQSITAWGSVQPVESSRDFEGEYQVQVEAIKVVTNFMLRAASTLGGRTFDPDYVVWRGDNYVVKTSQDYSRYGAGMIEATCDAVAFVNRAPQAHPL